MSDYLFDVKLLACFRIKARSEQQAREWLDDVLDSASVNAGALPNGEPLVGEASMSEDPVLIEFNGVPRGQLRKA